MEVSKETRGRVPVRLRRRANQPPLLEHYLKTSSAFSCVGTTDEMNEHFFSLFFVERMYIVFIYFRLTSKSLTELQISHSLQQLSSMNDLNLHACSPE